MTTGVRRKISSGREAAPADLGLLRAFRKAIPRVAEDDLGLALGLIGAHQKRVALSALAEGLEDGWLMLGLSGSALGPGAVCVDPVLVAALVQHQTLGSVAAEVEEARALTATDAALTVPLIDAILARLRDVSVYGLFRVERRMPDVRSMILPMDAESYLRADLTMDIACGRQQGRLLFLFPEPPAPKPDVPDRDPAERPVMKDTAMVVQVEMRAVLARLSLPLDALAGFHPGLVLPLANARMDRTDLVAIDGRRVATGRLGQAEGFRALRLNPVGHKPPPLEDSFSAHRRLGAGPAERAGEEPGDDLALADLSAEDAVAKISELAGLDDPAAAAAAGDAPPEDGDAGGKASGVEPG